MGVFGLTSYIVARSETFLKPFQLQDRIIILDGNSINYQLYGNHYPYSNDCYGGDYDTYAKVVENFFQLLFKCNVKPIIVFDGGVEERKLETIKQRLTGRLKQLKSLNPSALGQVKAFPLLLNQVFVDVIRKLGLQCIRWDCEADEEIAALARQWNCPVLSRDSDFFLFGVKYIPFDTVCMKLEGNYPDFYINCKIYHVDSLLQSHPGLLMEHLPLLSILLGNDYVDTKIFEKFKRQFGLDNTFKAHHQYITHVLTWLSTTLTVDKAIESILSYIDTADRACIERTLRTGVDNFMTTTSNLSAYLLTSKESPCDDFERRLRQCKYPACFMDLRLMQSYFQGQPVQDLSQPSAHLASSKVLQLLCAMVRPSSVGYKPYVFVYDRTDDATISKHRLTYMPDLSTQSQKRLEQVIPFNNWRFALHKDQWPDTWLVYAVSMKLWLEVVDPPAYCIVAIVICAIVLGVVYKRVGVCKDMQKINIKAMSSYPKANQNTLWDIDQLSCWQCLKVLHKYFIVHNDDGPVVTGILDYTVLHMLAQFQSCLLHINYVNYALKEGYKPFQAANFYNGTFIYNLIMDLKQHTPGRTYVQQLLFSCPAIYTLLTHILKELGIRT